MEKRIYEKPSFKAVNVEIGNLCAGSHTTSGAINVSIIKEMKDYRKSHYKFKKNQTIEDNMWNPNF